MAAGLEVGGRGPVNEEKKNYRTEHDPHYTNFVNFDRKLAIPEQFKRGCGVVGWWGVCLPCFHH